MKDTPVSNPAHMSRVMEVRLSCYLVFLSFDSKTKYQDSHTPPCPNPYIYWVTKYIMGFTTGPEYGN